MAIQHFWTATSSIAFPTGVRPSKATVSMLQLRKIYFHTPTKRLVGAWVQLSNEFEITGPTGALWRIGYMNRDGSVMDVFSAPVMLMNTTQPALCQTNDGRVLRSIAINTNRAAVELISAVGDVLFPITSRWAMDVLTNENLGYASHVAKAPNAAIVFPGSTAWVLEQPFSTTFRVLSQPGSTTLVCGVGSTWRNARDFLYVDFKTVAVTFMQQSAAGADATLPAYIRVFDTTSTPWTLKWIDYLPASDTRACFDPTNQVVYSCQQQPGAVIHASRLRQTPTSITAPSLGSGTSLTERTATALSVTVTGELGPISNCVVKWILSAGISGGTLNSQYSLTNDSGAASVTYVGPLMSQASSTQTVSAEIAEIWPKGLI